MIFIVAPILIIVGNLLWFRAAQRAAPGNKSGLLAGVGFGIAFIGLLRLAPALSEALDLYNLVGITANASYNDGWRYIIQLVVVLLLGIISMVLTRWLARAIVRN